MKISRLTTLCVTPILKSCIWILLIALPGKAIQDMEVVANYDSLPDPLPTPSLSLAQILLQGSSLDGQRLEELDSIIDMRLSTDGRSLYAIDYFGQMLIVFSVSQGGILGHPRQYRINSTPGIEKLGTLALDSDGRWLSVGGSGGIIRLKILDDGSLCCPRAYSLPYFINAIIPDRSGRFLYVNASTSQVVLVYQIQDDGSLTGPDICLTGVDPYSVGVFHPGNRFFYLLGQQRLSVYEVMSNGQLTFIQEVSDYGSLDGISLPWQLSHMVIDRLGTTLYVADEHANELLIFSVSEDGRLLKSSAINYSQFINGFGEPTGGPHFLALTGNNARLFLTSWETTYSWLRFLDFGESGNITHQEYYGNDLSSQSCTRYCFSPGPRTFENYGRKYTYQWVHSLAVSDDGFNIFASSSNKGGLLVYRTASIVDTSQRQEQALCEHRLSKKRVQLQKIQFELRSTDQLLAYFYNRRKNKQQQIGNTKIQLQAELESLENQLARKDSSAAHLPSWLWPMAAFAAIYGYH